MRGRRRALPPSSTDPHPGPLPRERENVMPVEIIISTPNYGVMNTFSPRTTMPAVTVTLIGLSIAASLPSLLDPASIFTPLLIASPGSSGFADILGGEVWRLV